MKPRAFLKKHLRGYDLDDALLVSGLILFLSHSFVYLLLALFVNDAFLWEKRLILYRTLDPTFWLFWFIGAAILLPRVTRCSNNLSLLCILTGGFFYVASIIFFLIGIGWLWSLKVLIIMFPASAFLIAFGIWIERRGSNNPRNFKKVSPERDGSQDEPMPDTTEGDWFQDGGALHPCEPKRD